MKTESSNFHTKIFYISVSVIFVVLIGIIIVYCIVFNNEYNNPSFWSDLVTGIGTIGTMLFTVINVLVFFKLTTSIAYKKEQHKIQEKQFEYINKFSHTISIIFPISIDNEFACDIPDEQFSKSIEWFNGFRKHKDLLPVLGETEYEEFIKQYIEFCGKYRDYKNYNGEESKEIFEGHEPEEEYYHLYLKALNIKNKMLDNIITISL